MQPEHPHSREEILQALASAETEVAAFFGGLDDVALMARMGSAWSPAEHLAHLCTSVSAVARGMAAPRWLLRLRFGRARAPSRSFAEVVAAYRAALDAGGVAPGGFVPPAEVGPAGERRVALLDRWGRVNARLRGAVEGWSEEALDRVVLPHPLLGRLTAREMLLFTLYHGGHHVVGARGRLGG